MTDSARTDDTTGFTDKMLLELARDTRKVAYSPYSNFTVGAACRARSGTAYFGCNVENSSYPVGICAERAAAACAIAHGEEEIDTIAIAGGNRDDQPSGDLRPCGMCLQFLSEIMDPDGRILIADGIDGSVEFTLGDLLPHAFVMKGGEGQEDQ